MIKLRKSIKICVKIRIIQSNGFFGGAIAFLLPSFVNNSKRSLAQKRSLIDGIVMIVKYIWVEQKLR